MGKYKLICMAFDGDYITETDRQHVDGFRTIEEAWRHDENMGSRWYFYPFHFVVTQKDRIADCPSQLPSLKHKALKTVRATFEALSVKPEMKDATIEDYLYSLEFAS